MRSYGFFNFICGALGAGFLFGIFLVFRSAPAPESVAVEIKDVPMVEKLETRNLKLGEEVEKEKLEHENTATALGGVPPEGGKNTKTQKQELDGIIPVRMNLPVPFTSQAPERNWDQPWQDACEEAAALMLDAYYKGYNLSPLFARDEILKMVEWERARGWQYSIEIAKVKELMGEYFGYDSKLGNKEIKKLRELSVVENPTVEQIKSSIAVGHPVLVVAHGKALPNPYFRDGGPDYHALIIRGYTEDSFITNDPGTWRGENFIYKYEDLMGAIHDWNEGNVKEGRRAVLMLE